MQKWPYFQVFLLGNIYQINVSYDILELKERLSRLKKQQVQNAVKLFSRRVNPFLRSKNSHFSNLFFQAIQASKMCFTIFWNEETPSQAIKTTSSKSRKIEIFTKGLTHGFSAKMATFPTFFFGNIGQETVFGDILERKTLFLGYKKKNFNKSKD